MAGRPSLDPISTKQGRIAQLARQMPGTALSTLAHHIDLDWLHEAARRTRKSGAPGVDGRSWETYAKDLEGNLTCLLDRAKSGTYRAPPVRRVYIPKGGGKRRPLGIPTLEDKILQRAVLMLLEPLYEQDFLECSYGFRPGRSAHDAVEAVWSGVMRMGGGWVLDVDIRGFFDNLDHAHLRDLLRRRVRDGVVHRLIGKWLNAGVLEDGVREHPETGTPQGGVISPLLANVYLHEVLDSWFEERVKPGLRGPAFLVRYADDVVLCFKREDDANQVREMLAERLREYGLELHPEKTRLVYFNRPRDRESGRRPQGGAKQGTFDFLGFTHFWGRSRKGQWIVKRKTAKDRFARAVKAVSGWLREVCFRERVRAHHPGLVSKMRGHYAYYGITGNIAALKRYYYVVRRLWKHYLCRRSQKGYINWPRYEQLLRHYPLPQPLVVHSIYKAQRTRGPRSRMR